MIFLGIDPGKSGAVGVLIGEKFFVYPTPVIGKDYDICGMKYLLAPYVQDGAFCVLERAQAMPKQGSVSMFEFGRGYGIWLGILACLGIQFQIVHARVWTRQMLEGAPGEGKERAVHVAQNLFSWRPKLKKEWQYADAILLAEYAKRLYVGRRIEEPELCSTPLL